MSTQTLTKTTSHAVIPLNKKKVTAGQVIRTIIMYFLLIFLSITFMIPLYWMAVSGLKTEPQVFLIPPTWWPDPARWANYIEGWQVQPFNLYLYNTVVRYAIPYVFGVLISNTLVAYSFGRLRWPGRDILFALCLMTMMIPGQVTMVPLFIVFKWLGWVNSYKPLIIPSFFASAYWIFMLRQFFRTIPEELSDAARIDGADEFQTLWYIILPLVKPAIAVVGLFSFMDAWNNYLGPLIYINSESMQPLALAIYRMRTLALGMGTTAMAYPHLMAVSTLVALPIILVFIFAQRTFIEGISTTGLKG